MSPASCFRPLAGIMVLIFSGSPGNRRIRRGWFPSPCGDYGSYHGELLSYDRLTEEVSVPLRGLWFLSIAAEIGILTNKGKFPSPCGDYGSYL